MSRVRLAAAVAFLAAAPLPGQSIASRVDMVRNGSVELVFASRPDVCGDGRGSVWTSGHGYRGSGDGICIHGPVRVTMMREDGRTINVRSCVACPSREGAPVTIIDAGADDAVRYLLGLARTVGGSSAGHAVSAAAFADADASSEFVRLARDANAPMAARKQAFFWLGQSDDPNVIQFFRDVLTR